MLLYIKKLGPVGLILLAALIFSIYLLSQKQLRDSIQQWRTTEDRKILSIATGRVFSDPTIGKVLKIKTPHEGLLLEIYKETDLGSSQLVDKIVIGKHYDSQFQFQARATNLALKDLNGDNVFEIIAPSFDASFASRLNIFQYNSDSKRFEIFTE